MEKIINLLEKDARMSERDIASALSMTELEVKNAIKKLEDERIILGYKPIINWEKVKTPHVTATVEIKFSLNDKIGFHELSMEISNMKEVSSVHLMSGGHDLAVVIKGKSIQDIAFFVNERLSVMECVLSTTTHFVLKAFKENDYILDEEKRDKREVVL